jgi:hypothetical protein
MVNNEMGDAKCFLACMTCLRISAVDHEGDYYLQILVKDLEIAHASLHIQTQRIMNQLDWSSQSLGRNR